MDATAHTGSARLPRYARAETDGCLTLTPRDLCILRLVGSFRLLTSEQICALGEGSTQGILRRLQRLFHDGYLDRIRPRFVPGGGSTKMVYAIANKGARALQNEGSFDNSAKTDRNAQNREVGELFVRHTLLVSHVHAMFLLACQGIHDSPSNKARFLAWREGREICDTIEVPLASGRAECPVAPDGFFSLGDAQGRRAHFFLEADRGSSQIRRFTLKLRAYAAYFRAKRHAERLGIGAFRVLTVTTGAVRSQNLLRAAFAEEDLRKVGWMFLFATEEDLPLSSPESVFAKIWTAPGKDEPCSLL